MSNNISARVWDKSIRLLLRSIPFFSVGPELFDIVKELKTSQTTLDNEVQEAVASIARTSELVSKLEQGLKERAARLESLKKEHEHYSELANVEAKKAEAVLVEIERTMGKNVHKERWISFWINIAAGVVLGVVVSNPILALCSKFWQWIVK